MLKLVLAILLGGVVGALFTKAAVRHRLRLWLMITSTVGVVSLLLAIDASLSGSAQPLWERALISFALVSSVVNLTSKRPARDERPVQRS